MGGLPFSGRGFSGGAFTVVGVAHLHILLPPPQALEVDVLLCSCAGGYQVHPPSVVADVG